MEKTSLNYSHLPPDLALWLTLSSSNYPCLEQIPTVIKMKFDCCNSFINISDFYNWAKTRKIWLKYHHHFFFFVCEKYETYTVDAPYLEFQGTL